MKGSSDEVLFDREKVMSVLRTDTTELLTNETKILDGSPLDVGLNYIKFQDATTVVCVEICLERRKVSWIWFLVVNSTIP